MAPHICTGVALPAEAIGKWRPSHSRTQNDFCPLE